MGKKILVAEDEPDVFKIFRYRLIASGFEVIMAPDGQQAVEMAKTHKPDLILLDYRMPVMNGLTSCKIIKEDQELKNIPVIFVTASSGNITQDILKSSQANAVVKKPFEHEELLAKIQGCLGG